MRAEPTWITLPSDKALSGVDQIVFALNFNINKVGIFFFLSTRVFACAGVCIKRFMTFYAFQIL